MNVSFHSIGILIIIFIINEIRHLSTGLNRIMWITYVPIIQTIIVTFHTFPIFCHLFLERTIEIKHVEQQRAGVFVQGQMFGKSTYLTFGFIFYPLIKFFLHVVLSSRFCYSGVNYFKSIFELRHKYGHW